MKVVKIHKFKTSVGWFRLASTDKGLAIINFFDATIFDSDVKKRFEGYKIKPGGVENKKAEKQIKSYLAGKLTKFSLKLDIEGTPFQQKVLRQICAIKYGNTNSYGKIAASVGSPQAARAVGSVNAKNALPIVIPCHRVLSVNGLGGYAGGLDLKRKLLDLEQAKY